MKPAHLPEQISQQPRRGVRLPSNQVQDLRAVCRERGDVFGQLVRGWLDDAVVRACSGLPLPLDSGQTAGRDSLRLVWSQSEAEYQRWSQLFELLGSSMQAVIGERVALHVETRGNRALAGMRLQAKYGDGAHRLAQQAAARYAGQIAAVLEELDPKARGGYATAS